MCISYSKGVSEVVKNVLVFLANRLLLLYMYVQLLIFRRPLRHSLINSLTHSMLFSRYDYKGRFFLGIISYRILLSVLAGNWKSDIRLVMPLS